MSAMFMDDPLAWSVELKPHFCGQFSMASIQSHVKIEDKCQVEVCDNSTFIGFYDGCKGDEASKHLTKYVFPTLLEFLRKYKKRFNIDEDAARKLMTDTFSKVEEDFTMEADWGYEAERKPYMSVVSFGCLICMISGRNLYLANVGDSRAILCSNKRGPRLRVKQMLRDHNCENIEIRNEVQELHTHDDTIFSNIFGKWLIKGLSETSKCIGNAYLKKKGFTTKQSFEAPPGEKVTSLFTEPVLSADPEFYTRVLKDTDKFIIFGSGGFWKLVTNEEAARMINDNPQRDGIAKRLAAHAVKVAAELWSQIYNDVIRAPKGIDKSGKPFVCSEPIRPLYHDDISVTVVYLDLNQPVAITEGETYSYRSHNDDVLPSQFNGEVDEEESWADY